MSLNQEEFLDAACRLYETVTLPEKNVLANRKERSRSGSVRALQKAAEDEDLKKRAFKPKLNPNSLRIAEKKYNKDLGQRVQE